MVKGGLPDFTNKVVFVNFTRGGDGYQLLSNPHIEDHNGQLFLVGVLPGEVIPGFDGKTVGIAWSSVEQYFVFDSIADYRQAFSQFGWANWRSKWAARIGLFTGSR